ncbi:MAG TPA: hypothetical protein VFA26_08445, partial [Gemmataceae bacterium]|nr:hypothetical protein [Gemmataceae bacterium]
LDQAAEEMKRAGEQMDQGQAGDEQQDDALDRLDEAQRELERAREDTEEELAREQLAKVADLIKRIKERHEGFIAERERIQDELLRQKQWRGLLISLGRLAEAQGETGLAGETASLAEEKLKGAPIFAKTMKKSADAMKGAAEKIIEHRQQVSDGGKAETPAGAEAARLQKEALRRLDQLLEALKEEPGAPLRAQKKKQDGQQPGGGEGGGGGGGGGGGDGIPPLAQLKLLRAMQAEINQRTDEFTRQHPDKDKMDDRAKAELKALQRDQQEVAELLEELTRPADEGGKP